MFGALVHRGEDNTDVERPPRGGRGPRRPRGSRTRGVHALLGWVRGLDRRDREALTSAGHELKAPLSVLLARCDRIDSRGGLSPADADDLASNRANAYALLRRVNDMMLVSGLEDGEVDPNLSAVDVAALVRDCATGFASVAELRGVELRNGGPERLIAVVDEDHLVSIVANLLANAIRHAPSGGHVRCSLSPALDGIRIEVADSGAGIDPALHEQLFKRYRHGADSNGMGLGLAIVSDLLELHNGSITIGSAPEGGALFVVDLPVRFAESGAPPAPSGLTVADRERAMVEELRSTEE
jgi:signal transduction histidine kinase